MGPRGAPPARLRRLANPESVLPAAAGLTPGPACLAVANPRARRSEGRVRPREAAAQPSPAHCRAAAAGSGGSGGGGGGAGSAMMRRHRGEAGH
eukprot:346662-Chlamydomonas_euryale.AAC.2